MNDERNQFSIQFYLPFHRDGIESLPKTPEDYWPWIVKHRAAGEGKYSWTLQTCLLLQKFGVPCALVQDFPSRGIVISHRDFLPVFLRPRTDVFLVCIKPDRKEHSWAQHHLVQNRFDPAVVLFGSGRVTEVLQCPQPSLRARDNQRGSRVENVAYFGRSLNLAPELTDPAWQEELVKLGFRWMTPPLEHWDDYREVDVVVAIRSLGEGSSAENAILDPNCKPPTKLTNAWLAGVPAIVGIEPSFRAIRRDPLDCIEVDSKVSLKQALLRLRAEPELYESMQRHGLGRAEEFSVEAVAAHWKEVVSRRILPAYEQWMRQPRWQRQARLLAGFVAYFLRWRNIVDLLSVLMRMARPAG